jgi:DNA polymerase-3 subunit delta
MPVASAAAVRKQVAQRQPDPVYLIVGDDEAEMSGLAGAIAGLVEDELRAFNSDRFYAGERGVTPAAIVEAARTLPMMSDRRVVTLLRAEKMLKPKRRGKAAAEEPADEPGGEPPTGLDVLEAYIKDPVRETTLVMVASDVDRTRKLYKTLQKESTIIECWGLRGGRDVRVDLRDVARTAEQMVKQAVSAAGQVIEPPAARLVAERAGTDIARLRGDVDRLLLYTSGTATITLDDARQVVSAETAQDDWVPAAIEALFRTDLELKSSGDARVLLERLVVQLCRG